jgi:leucyl aminopeptidase
MSVDKGDKPSRKNPAVTPITSAARAAQAQRLMRFTLQTSSPATQRANVLVIGAFADRTLSPAAKVVDAASKGRLAALLGRGDLDIAIGSSLMLYDLPGTAAQRVLVVSLGPPTRLDDDAFLKALKGAARTLAAGRAQEAIVTLAELDVPGRSLTWRLQQASRVLADAHYRFAAPKSAGNGINGNGNGNGARGASDVSLSVPGAPTPEMEDAVRCGEAIAEGMGLTKDLGNLPGNICNPPYLANLARALGAELGFEVEILEREEMRKLGMGSALSVGRASSQPCKFIVMSYRGREGARPVVLVGKGVTFDTGGISLKPGDDLDMMKYDMCGAASVFGAMKIAARLSLPLNLIGIVGAVENMPGGDASRPGDVVTSMSGQTIEILNTDAEGRLVLCDALTYAERFDPACVIDIATLTGACVIALGTQTSGLFANDDVLAERLLRCGTDTGDRAWRMPLWEEYQEQLRSNFADMSNLGGRPAGSITAACFLSRFTKSYKWAHLDIAGTASVGGEAKGATGRPIPLLSEFLISAARESA